MTTLYNHKGPFVNEQEELFAYAHWALTLLKARLKWACRSDEGVQKAFIATGVADCILEALGRLLVIPGDFSGVSAVEKLKVWDANNGRDSLANAFQALALLEKMFNSILLSEESIPAGFITSDVIECIREAKSRTETASLEWLDCEGGGQPERLNCELDLQE